MSEQVKIQVLTLGEIVVKFEMPQNFIDEINNVFEEKEQTTVDWSTQLAGKIKKEKLVNHLLRDEVKGTFFNVFSRIYEKVRISIESDTSTSFR